MPNQMRKKNLMVVKLGLLRQQSALALSAPSIRGNLPVARHDLVR